ncbi:twitching motility protein (plasmid) [Deinococcus proteolyticus MRP]|uniref:Twitching motility protein n=1 Tax=Deinococcus proteolyticus (strain ATCC 35074 / DSM 20540 / JCM 6276 / NBRC 101906 / NCIMB 13154 / VKM Ac-1939 / CCM 2703 / MRP) TaxID=693977 RepID=F0RQK8_DEIPM|nr:PilT/PilU family type 4a pilus ATPase [Deinococcus proteolyticus]ADY27567.1 twitching motility protein [Deinococcus proteolyticus MRP]
MNNITLDMLEAILEEGVEQGASDIILKHQSLPLMRLNGEWHPYNADDAAAPTIQDLKDLAASLLNDRYEEFLERREADLQLSTDHHRFRVNIAFQRSGPFMTFRPIAPQPPELEDLNLLDALTVIPFLKALVEQPRGLVLVTGPTGSGKSTTLAALINHINKRYRKHIITIEDPLEFLHTDQKSTIEQREIGNDTQSFANALRSVLRQAPDIILVGEMRDPETIAAAMTAAETGHLVISTVHTNNAPKSINRIIDAMPSDQANQIRTQLAASLVGVVTQQLVPRKDKGRQVALEIMTVTDTIRGHIRNPAATENNYYDFMTSNRETGQILMDQQLALGVRENLITDETARAKSMALDRLQSALRSTPGTASPFRFAKQ